MRKPLAGGKWRALVWCLVLSIGLAGCSLDSPPPPTVVPAQTATTITIPTPTALLLPNPTTAQPHAVYKATKCPFGKTPASECGILTVPEDRSKPNGRTIDLFVVVLKSTGGNPAPDPLIFLNGGPGAYTVAYVGPYYGTAFQPALATRDVIILDQRGVGLSKPALECPEVSALGPQMLEQGNLAGKNPPEAEAAYMSCRDRLIEEGNNLSAYNTAENAADVEDLRLALGYKQWNLLGFSYGTTLSLAIMRDFPTGLRSVIVDSPAPSLPAQVSIPNSAANVNRSLELMFKECAADTACNGAYPNLKQVFYDTVQRLNTQPVVITGTLTFTGDELLMLAAQSLNDTTTIAGLPKMIYEVHQGYNITAMSALQRLVQQDSGSTGMTLSVMCNDLVPLTSREQRAADDSEYPALNYVFSSVREYDFCSSWGMGQPTAGARQPVQSNVPTLVLTGQYDISTPPEYGDIALQTLGKGYHVTFPGMGHGQVFSNECPASIAWAFLADPAAQPDTSCVRQMKGPQWDVSP